MKSALRRSVLAVLLLLLLLVAYALAQPSEPHTRAEIRHLTALLNEIAAIDVPHNRLIGADGRAEHIALLEKVESGALLNAQESRDYRILYQRVIRDNLWLLAPLDEDLTVRFDFCMDCPNNVGGQGIVGDHDHHDHSARENFADLRQALARVENADGPFAGLVRVRQANRAYKELTDIMLHMGTAPHTVSVPYAVPDDRQTDALSGQFEELMKAYKQAQFEPVNSPAYRLQVEAAMTAYDALVWETQRQITDRLSSFEQRLAGRWLAQQTFSPNPDPDLELRFPRQ